MVVRSFKSTYFKRVSSPNTIFMTLYQRITITSDDPPMARLWRSSAALGSLAAPTTCVGLGHLCRRRVMWRWWAQKALSLSRLFYHEALRRKAVLLRHWVLRWQGRWMERWGYRRLEKGLRRERQLRRRRWLCWRQWWLGLLGK